MSNLYTQAACELCWGDGCFVTAQHGPGNNYELLATLAGNPLNMYYHGSSGCCLQSKYNLRLCPIYAILISITQLKPSLQCINLCRVSHIVGFLSCINGIAKSITQKISFFKMLVLFSVNFYIEKTAP